MSKMLSSMDQASEIRRNKLTEVLEKGRHGEEQTKPVPQQPHQPQHEDFHHYNHHGTEKHPFFGVPALMGAVIVLGIIFVVVNQRVLAELNTVRNSVNAVMTTSGSQTDRVKSIEQMATRSELEFKKLRKDLDRRDRETSKLFDKVRNDISETEISVGILRSKMSEFNVTQRNFTDRFIDLSDEIKRIKRSQAATSY